MRRGLCPRSYCRQPMIFSTAAKFVKCRGCETAPTAIEELRSVVAAQSDAMKTEWELSKARTIEISGAISNGRVRMANRSIDGIGNLTHCRCLWRCFDHYGLTEDTGEAKRLSAMGRSEPFNVGTLGDYAFGMRKEHADVALYGKDIQSAAYLAETIDAVSSLNGSLEDSLVPISTQEKSWPLSLACLISRACVGREVFARRIAIETIKNLKKFRNVYEKHTCDTAFWARINGVDTTKILEEIDTSDETATSDVELAAMANVLYRPILLMDAKPTNAIVNVFLPVLRRPDQCRNWNGVLRSPLVLAWSSETHWRKVALVATTGTSALPAVRLPRKWFKSVWGAKNDAVAEKLLMQYVHFDDQNSCAVATGKYFKPEYMRRIVTAFESHLLKEVGVPIHLLSEFIDDGDVPPGKDVELLLMEITTHEQLWRCLRCDQLTATETSLDAPMCPNCNMQRELRKQHLDGTVSYFEGDHTLNPAPNSWCFLKRKHLINGVEYDNPPMSFDLQLRVNDKKAHEKIEWFYGDSNEALNSTPSAIVGQLKKKYTFPDRFAEAIEAEVAKSTHPEELQQHRKEHLKDVLDVLGVTTLLDDAKPGATVGDGAMRDKKMILGLDRIFDMANESYMRYFQNVIGYTLLQDVGVRDSFIAKADAVQTMTDQVLIYQLEGCLGKCDQEQRWRLICRRKDLFGINGMYYHMALRQGHAKGDHFQLPLLGNARFAFGDPPSDELVVCLPGGHFPVHESVDVLCLVMTECPDGREECDHVVDSDAN